jgi:predicted metal-dependent hydrolase
MPLDFASTPAGVIRVGSQDIPIQFVHNRRARRYIIRLRPDGSVRATVPRVGSLREARAFAERSVGWIARQLQKRARHPAPVSSWGPGTEILFRGTTVSLAVSANHDLYTIQFADQTIHTAATGNFRPVVERRLWHLAKRELPERTAQLAALHEIDISRVTVRNQRSRWGSCSPRGTVSLNWRLIQTPDFVRDYIIIHELMHRREMNHSTRFWRLVAQNFPCYQEAEAWLKKHRGLLR